MISSLVTIAGSMPFYNATQTILHLCKKMCIVIYVLETCIFTQGSLVNITVLKINLYVRGKLDNLIYSLSIVISSKKYSLLCINKDYCSLKPFVKKKDINFRWVALLLWSVSNRLVAIPLNLPLVAHNCLIYIELQMLGMSQRDDSSLGK